jgi:hypothetical protein
VRAGGGAARISRCARDHEHALAGRPRRRALVRRARRHPIDLRGQSRPSLRASDYCTARTLGGHVESGTGQSFRFPTSPESVLGIHEGPAPAVGRCKPRASDLSPQDLKLVTQHRISISSNRSGRRQSMTSSSRRRSAIQQREGHDETILRSPSVRRGRAYALRSRTGSGARLSFPLGVFRTHTHV